MQNQKQQKPSQFDGSIALQIGKMALLFMVIWSLTLTPAIAAKIDPYVARYLRAVQPIEIPLDASGQTRAFSGIELSNGKQLFDGSCKTCHVGGSTLPDPTVPLSLAALQGATPPRDTVSSLVTFMRQPMTYDGSEESLSCRKISPAWMSQQELENLSAFILRAAAVAPGWGSAEF